MVYYLSPSKIALLLLDCQKWPINSALFSFTPPQESVTDYTTPSSSLPNTVATNNAKMEDTLVNNVSKP